MGTAQPIGNTSQGDASVPTAPMRKVLVNPTRATQPSPHRIHSAAAPTRKVLIFPFLGFEYRVVDQFHILVVQAHVVGFGSLICKCMLEPVCIIALRVISAIMRSPAFSTRQCAMNSSLGALKQEPKLDGLDHFRVKGF